MTTEPVRFYVGDPTLGEPEVETITVNASDVVPGEAVWDSRDRRFYMVDVAYTHEDGTTVLTYTDGTPEPYQPRIQLSIAIWTHEAVAFNAHKTGGRAA